MVLNFSNNVNYKKRRDSNIELFRIITMLLIVAHHYVVNSGLLEVMSAKPLSGKSIFLFVLGAWGKIGINCFVFITGYFMCKSNITLKKFVKLLFEIIFYNILFYFVFVIAGYHSFSLGTLIWYVLPVPPVSDNFGGCYLIFFLFIPFINILIRNISRKQHIILIALSCFVYVFLGSMPGFVVSMNYVSWFIVLYFISSYVRLYQSGGGVLENKYLWLIMSVICVLASALSIFIGLKMEMVEAVYFFVADSNKFLAVITAFSLFMFFKNIKISYNRFINVVASSTFGVLLIHANSDIMRQWLWRDTLNNAGMYNSPYLYIHAICSVLAVYCICVVIDQIRIRLIEKPFFMLWDKYSPRVNDKYNILKYSILNKLDLKDK